MARTADQFRRSDVTLWGLVAVVAGGVALLSANVSALVPDQFFAGLHDSRLIDHNAARLQGGLAEIAEAKTALAEVRATTAALQSADAQLASRVDGVLEQAAGVRERVGALEGALPRLIKHMPLHPAAGPPLVTGSIGAEHRNAIEATVPDVDGGSAWMRRLPLQPTPERDQPMPSLLAPSPMVPGPLMPAPQAPNSLPAAGVPPYPQATATAVPPVASASTLPLAAGPADAAGAATAPGSSATGTQTATASASMSASLAATGSRDVDVMSVTAAPSGADPAASTPIRAVVPLAPIRTGSTATATAATPGAIASANSTPAPASPANVRAIGIAVGPAVQPAAALSAWEGLAAKIGVMLVGMSPLLADDPAGSAGKVLVAGPIAGIAVATTLCANIDRAGIACTPMPYVGTELKASGAPAPP